MKNFLRALALLLLPPVLGLGQATDDMYPTGIQVIDGKRVRALTAYNALGSGVFLKLDASNDPVTGQLDVNTLDANGIVSFGAQTGVAGSGPFYGIYGFSAGIAVRGEGSGIAISGGSTATNTARFMATAAGNAFPTLLVEQFSGQAATVALIYAQDSVGGQLFYTDAAGETFTKSLKIESHTLGSILFSGASDLVTEDNANLFWDDASDRLGIKNNTPAEVFRVNTPVTEDGSIQSLFTSVNTAKCAVGIQLPAGQIADALEIENQLGVPIFRITANGGLIGANINQTVQSAIASVGNLGAGEDDLITHSLSASTLSANGQWIEVIGTITFAANANSKRVKAYFGATTIYDSTAQIQSGGALQVRILITRTGAATQNATATAVAGATTPLFADDSTFTNPAETLSGAITIKFTGEGVADNDIVNRDMKTLFYPVP